MSENNEETAAQESPAKEKVNENITPLTLDEIEKDEICKRWITYNLTEPKNDDHKKVEKYYAEKEKFWKDNMEHLKANGFRHSTGLSTALDFVENEKHDTEACLLLVKVGSNERPASPDDLTMARKMIDEAMDGTKNYHIVVTGHDIHVERIPLSKLRQLESAVLKSETEGSSASIMRDMEL